MCLVVARCTHARETGTSCRRRTPLKGSLTGVLGKMRVLPRLPNPIPMPLSPLEGVVDEVGDFLSAGRPVEEPPGRAADATPAAHHAYVTPKLRPELHPLPRLPLGMPTYTSAECVSIIAAWTAACRTQLAPPHASRFRHARSSGAQFVRSTQDHRDGKHSGSRVKRAAQSHNPPAYVSSRPAHSADPVMRSFTL